MKKINSEIKINDEVFSVKIGTTDKKNPDTIYIELGTYLTPLTNANSFKAVMEGIESTTKKFITKSLLPSPHFKNDFIFVSDIATDRMMANKKSFYEMQLFVKPQMSLMERKNFKEVSDSIKIECLDSLLDFIKNNFSSQKMMCSKTKK